MEDTKKLKEFISTIKSDYGKGVEDNEISIYDQLKIYEESIESPAMSTISGTNCMDEALEFDKDDDNDHEVKSKLDIFKIIENK
jgi:hypothetical protein